MAYPEHPPGKKVDGKLIWDSEVSEWVVIGPPHVTAFACQIFPSAKMTRSDAVCAAKFAVTWRSFVDLMILLWRFKLTIDPIEEFDRQWSVSGFRQNSRETVNESMSRHPPPSLSALNGKLKPFQTVGVKWSIANRRTVIADEMGLGKTVQALATLSATGGFPALVCVESNLVRQWAEVSIPQWLPQAKVFVARGQTPQPIPMGCPIVVTSYNLLPFWRKKLAGHGFKSIVWDEIQAFRNHKAEKTIAGHALAKCGSVENVLGLSGTPIYNYGAETWSVYQAVEPNCLGDRDSFLSNWCDGDSVKIPEALNQYLRDQGLLIRRLQQQVGEDLPPIRRLVEEVDSDASVAAEFIKRAEDAVQRAIMSDFSDLAMMENAAVQAIRQATGVAKTPAVAAFVRNLIDCGVPPVVFAHHKSVRYKLGEYLAEFNPVHISGDENAGERKESIRKFTERQPNGRFLSDVCIVSNRCAVGLDGLQHRADTAVTAELDYAPAVHLQNDGRVGRIGQKSRFVRSYYLVSEFGSDPTIRGILGLKRSQFDGIMGQKADLDAEQKNAAILRAEMKRLVFTRRGSMRGKAS
jgi:SNF2 family DNA or RNA helicase